MTVVIDASAFLELLLQTPRAPEVTKAIGDSTPLAPDLIGPEVVSVLRRLEHKGVISTARAETALHRFEKAPLQTVKHGNSLAGHGNFAITSRHTMRAMSPSQNNLAPY